MLSVAFKFYADFNSTPLKLLVAAKAWNFLTRGTNWYFCLSLWLWDFKCISFNQIKDRILAACVSKYFTILCPATEFISSVLLCIYPDVAMNERGRENLCLITVLPRIGNWNCIMTLFFIMTLLFPHKKMYPWLSLDENSFFIKLTCGLSLISVRKLDLITF